MGKFDVTAAAGNAANEETKAEAQAPTEAPAAAKLAAKKPAARKPAAKKPAAKKPAAKKPATSAPKAPASIAAPTAMLEALLAEADVQSEGLAQIAIRVPPSLKTRLKATMSRAGLTQEKFVAALIGSGLDELEAILDSRGKA